MVLTTPVKMHAYSPQKMHMHPCMHDHATLQELLCHGNYCELILSLAQSIVQAVVCRPPCCCLDEISFTTLFTQEIRPNPR